ncbi:UNVERIFIED_CONTAM: hypothetical protein Sindi_1152700, partial [Sesamum indicum]
TYFEHGFMACKEQFKAHGYPPSGEEPSFLAIATAMKNAPDPFLDVPAPEEDDLDNILEEAEAKVRGPPPEAIIESTARDLLRVGARKEGDTPKDVDACLSETFVDVTSKEKNEGPACGEKI